MAAGLVKIQREDSALWATLEEIRDGLRQHVVELFNDSIPATLSKTSRAIVSGRVLTTLAETARALGAHKVLVTLAESGRE